MRIKISATISSFGHLKFSHKLLFFCSFRCVHSHCFFRKLYLTLYGGRGEKTYVRFFSYFVFQIISPPENDSFRKDLCFAVVYFLSFFFSPRNLRAPSTDRREITHDARCCVQFYNPGPKFLGSLPKKF